jgi:hypothetical protein
MEGTKFKKGARFHGRVEHPQPTPCADKGCREPGEFRAPAKDGGEGWRWLCLDHVREFNARYNFFNGMTPDEIAAAQSPHPSWERRTRPFATNTTAQDFADPHGLFRKAQRPRTASGRPLETADSKALAILGLDEKAALKDIRRRYTELVRRYHPDRNGGDRSHEGKLQDVIQAYTHLRKAPAFAS